MEDASGLAYVRPSADLSVYKSSSSSNTTPESSVSRPATDWRGLSIAIPRAFQPSLDMSALPPPKLASESAVKSSPRLYPGGVVTLPKLSGSAVSGSESSRATSRVPPPLPKQSSIEDYVFKASKELLSVPGSANLVWCTADGEADYRRLRTDDFYNHFQNNHELTTKVGLANNLLQYAVASRADVDAFFPRCYDVGRGRMDRDDFVLDFRRAAALKVVLQHLRLEERTQADKAYECNLDVLRVAKWTLERWCRDLDTEHLDEETDPQEKKLGEEDWDALVLYSELPEEQLLGRACEEACLVQHSRRRHTRIGGGDLDDDRQREQKLSSAAARPIEIRNWSEFRGHRWGSAPDMLRPALLATTESLKRLCPQFPLHGGWMGRNIWIVKPGSNSKGSGIECMSTLPELLHHCDTMPNRVVQKYIERPLLLFSGRKFDIRQWVLVRSVAPLRIFLFSECYLRLCNDMYDLGDLRNRERHISNWQVNKHGKNIVDGACASLEEFREELKEITGSGTFWEDKLLPQMEHIVIETMRSVEGKLVPRDNSFELYGFDVMVDENMHMWLLEANLSPACEGRTPFLNTMLSRMAKRLIEVAILGQEAPDGERFDWIKICDDAANDRKARSFDAAQRTTRDLPCSIDLTLQGQQLRIPRRGRSSQEVALHEEGEATPSCSSRTESLPLSGAHEVREQEPVLQNMVGSEVLADEGGCGESLQQGREDPETLDDNQRLEAVQIRDDEPEISGDIQRLENVHTRDVDLEINADIQRLEDVHARGDDIAIDSQHCETIAPETEGDMQRLVVHAPDDSAAIEAQHSPKSFHKLSFDETSCEGGDFENASQNDSNEDSYASDHSSSKRDRSCSSRSSSSRSRSSRHSASSRQSAPSRSCSPNPRHNGDEEADDRAATRSCQLDQHSCTWSEGHDSTNVTDKPGESLSNTEEAMQESQPVVAEKAPFDEVVCRTAESGSVGSDCTTQSPRAENDAYSEFEDEASERSVRCSSEDDFET